MSRSFDLPDVDWATVGTIGPPGQRVFYLQARQGEEQVTLKLPRSSRWPASPQFLGEILSDLPVDDPPPDDEAMALAELIHGMGRRRAATGL